ncbi:hypothetical protein [Oryza sativa Japonica Group]|uniref:Uncharacterized protein n=1 Tax=Oryza sativa subsp. japonica TaxID=39947 RepID=Q5SNJ3_ORYSJ|nr:hypothetical protein [Oryza sativa Japonica Group]
MGGGWVGGTAIAFRRLLDCNNSGPSSRRELGVRNGDSLKQEASPSSLPMWCRLATWTLPFQSHGPLMSKPLEVGSRAHPDDAPSYTDPSPAAFSAQ